MILTERESFSRRHIGPRPVEIQGMAQTCGFPSLDALIDAAMPPGIRSKNPLQIPNAISEFEALKALRLMAAKNQVFRSFIGMGYNNTITPPVIQRNMLENPGWYTQYTPYQAEISQGRLEGLLNFQTLIRDLTSLDIANASLLDEATACAEAMHLCASLKEAADRSVFLVDHRCHPQNIDVLRTRATPLGISLIIGDPATLEITRNTFGILVQYPGTDGVVRDFAALAERAHQGGALLVVAADLLSLTLLKPPGEFGADIAVGSAQRFGVPLGYGGPHAAFFATRDAFKRSMPGRLVGVSRDARGKPALRLSLQTREQHIRREKATSNICTAQALLANMAMAYAAYHGPVGLTTIATRINRLTHVLASVLRGLGYDLGEAPFFDTLSICLSKLGAPELARIASSHRINLCVVNDSTVRVSLDETTTLEDVRELAQIFNADRIPPRAIWENAVRSAQDEAACAFPATFRRSSPFLTQPVFNQHHSETEMLRYLRKLESKDLSLCHSMIPLGSCTMKLNASCEMFPVSWPEFASLHPFAPLEQTRGYQEMFSNLEDWLKECTGFFAISLQPNAGSQGEYAGLLAIRRYHESRGNAGRSICIIPTSAHGTNPASAVMCGFQVVPVECDTDGNIDIADLRSKAALHGERLAALMITYPSTHGVFETSIRQICDLIHAAGGQVYMDGANMNAQVGLTSPGEIGADVCHLNLHKTFCIPHGGGGPGMGPIGVASHLAPFLPGHPVVVLRGSESTGAVSAAPWGSASILAISWVYIACMGPQGLTDATKVAILNANYIARKLENHFPVLYKGPAGLVAHECILDLRRLIVLKDGQHSLHAVKHATAEDVAKRLMDYGIHAPTLSWPVAGTLMVEPTESEPKCELDRFCEAMISIHAEIMAIEAGRADVKNNVLKNAPHTADQISSDSWNRPYSRDAAAFPVESLREFKFWPAVGRIDNVYGDRNLICNCVGMDSQAP